MLQDRGTSPEEEDGETLVRKYKVMHEKILSSWLKEDVEGMDEGRKDGEERFSGKRKVEREEERTVGVERRCVGLFFQ